MSIQARVLEALRWTTATRFGGYLLTWSINLLVIRLLEPADYGLAALCMAWVGFPELLSAFGQRTVLVQRPTLEPGLLRRIFGALILWNALLFAAGLAAAPAIAAFHGDPALVPMFRLMALAVLLNSFVILPTVLRVRELDFQAVSMIGLAHSATANGVVLVLAFRGYGAWALIGGQFAGVVVRVVATLAVTRFRMRPDFRIGGLGAELRFGGLVLTRLLVDLFDSRVDAILIGKLLGGVPLGVYSAAGSVAKQPGRALVGPILGVARPAFARIQDRPEQIARYYLRAVEALTFAFVPLVWGIGLVADDLVRVVMGARWEPAIPLIQVLCVFLPLRSPTRVVGSILDGIGRPDVALRQAVTAAVCAPIGVVVGAQAGVLGATVGWCVAMAVALGWNLRRALPIIGVSPGQVVAEMRPTLVAGALMAAAVLAAKATLWTEMAPAARGLASALLGAAVFGAVTWVSNPGLVRRYLELLRRGSGPEAGRDEAGPAA